MRKAMCVVVGAALLSVAPVLAQKSPEVCQISVWKVKPGAGAAWAEGRKKHMEFHKQQKDALGWYTWEIINGDRAGSFITGTFDHYWKDFDGREAFDVMDAADIAKTSGPATESSSDGYWIHMGAASRNEPGATGPSKYSQLVHYYVRIADVPRFEDALETITAELNKTTWRRTALCPLDPTQQLRRLCAAREGSALRPDRIDGRDQGDRSSRRRPRQHRTALQRAHPVPSRSELYPGRKVAADLGSRR